MLLLLELKGKEGQKVTLGIKGLKVHKAPSGLREIPEKLGRGDSLTTAGGQGTFSSLQ